MNQDSAVSSANFIWYGQSGYKFTTPSGKVFLVDPWLDCPSNPHKDEEWDRLGKVDLILLTHGHFDHSANTPEIAKRTGAELVTVTELADALVKYLDFPTSSKIHKGTVGSVVKVLDGELFSYFPGTYPEYNTDL